jgi:hypothetical protein
MEQSAIRITSQSRNHFNNSRPTSGHRQLWWFRWFFICPNSIGHPLANFANWTFEQQPKATAAP